MSQCSRFTRLIHLLGLLSGFAAVAQTPHYSKYVESYDVPDVVLTNSHGTALRLNSLLDRPGPLAMQFIFTSCTTICPVMTAAFHGLASRLGRGWPRARLISISIDPEYDTPSRLAEFAHKVKAGPEWVFLTGKPQGIAAVREAFRSSTDSKMSHVPLTFLRASPDAPWVRLEGLTSAAELEAEYRLVCQASR
jgi:protein SCO1/2